MSTAFDPSMSFARRLWSPPLGVAGPHPTPRLATAPRRPVDLEWSLAGGLVSVMTPDSWHLPGRHEHGRPLLRPAGAPALARSWS
jgi:hypothetical protein